MTDEMKDALELIERQKAENEELRSDKIIAERHEKDARDLFVDCTRQLEGVKSELKQLQITLDEYPVKTLFDKNNLICSKTSEDYEKLIMKIANSTIKEFAENVCKGRVGNDPVVIAVKAELDYMLSVGLEEVPGMSENLRELIREAFSGCYTLTDVAMLYFDIRTECEKQLTYANFNIAKEMQEGDRIEVI